MKTNGGDAGVVDFRMGDNICLSYTAMPEPSAALLGGLVLLRRRA